MKRSEVRNALGWYVRKKPWNVRGDTTSGRKAIVIFHEAASRWVDPDIEAAAHRLFKRFALYDSWDGIDDETRGWWMKTAELGMAAGLGYEEE